MAKRRKPQMPLQPLLIVDDRNQPDEAWIPSSQLPTNIDYGWSDRMLVCQFKPGDRHPILLIASYNFLEGQWRSAMGAIENVTHYQPLPDFPRETK